MRLSRRRKKIAKKRAAQYAKAQDQITRNFFAQWERADYAEYELRVLAMQTGVIVDNEWI